MWINYDNGNYKVYLDDSNGTKIRFNPREEKLIATRPESMDVKITNKCEYGCLFCHEASIKNGKQASYESINIFLNNIEPYTELACGGGSIMSDIHHTEYFLKKAKEAKCFPSITIHQNDFIKYNDIIKKWYNNKLIYGIGISLHDSNNKDFLNKIKDFPTAILHVIVGMFNEDDLNNLKNKHLKILFLGYKTFRRGRLYYTAFSKQIHNNTEWLSNNIKDIIHNFNTVAFDNLALEQLKIKEILNKDEWDTFYMGDDGQYTFYIDLTTKTFAKNSTSLTRYSVEKFNWDINKMFEYIKKE